MISKILSLLLSVVAFFSGFTVNDSGDVIKYRNLPYGLNAGKQILDLNIPKSASGDANMILYVHGGTWSGGNKDGYESSLDNVSSSGYVSASLNYRYCGFPNFVTVQDILDDITSALEKIKETAAENGVNIKGVMFNGISAGAHLSLLYAYSRYDEAPIKPVAVIAKSPVSDLTDAKIYDGSLHNINPDEWYISKSEWCRHLTFMTGQLITPLNLSDKTAALYDISPIKYVNKNCVPTIIVHGTADTALPYENSVAFDKKLTEYGVEHKFITYNGAGHTLENCPEGLAEYNKAFSEYKRKYLALK